MPSEALERATHGNDQWATSNSHVTLPKSSPTGSINSLQTTPSKRFPPPVKRASNLSTNSFGSTGSGSSFRGREVDVVFIDPLEKKYECPVCKQVLRYPVQFEECGHRCCSSCLPELMRVSPRCPIDQVLIDRDKCYVDKPFQRQADNLGVRCSFYSRGCTWTGVVKELMSHLEHCEHYVIVCPMMCGVEFEKRFLDKHAAEDCPKRKIQCQFCERDLIAEQEGQHLEVCGKFLIPCPNSCKKREVPREQLKEHLESRCMKQEQDCPFGEYGCQYKGVKKQLREHMEECYLQHIGNLCEAIKRLNSIIDTQAIVMDENSQILSGHEKRIDALEKLYGAQLIWKIDNYQEKLSEAKSGKKTTIFSSPFLTSRYGYRMALSACLFGDGKARGKYMSIFICICKGDYDALLAWPFAHRLSFTLIDQCQDPEARRNVNYSVKPNTCKENKPFLGRPVGERNASFGTQKFVELDLLNTLDYIRDDTIFIKVVIDSEDMTQI